MSAGGLKVEIQQNGSERVHVLSGTIDEEFLPELMGPLTGPVVFDFADVRLINSLGIRKWVNLIKSLATVPVSYERVSRVVSRQILIVPSFKGHAQVRSAVVDFYCDACDKETSILLTRDTYANGGGARMLCESCKQPVACDLTPPRLATLFGGAA